jgi:hypothetical protein
MAERVVACDVGIRWEPNAPDARFLFSDAGAARLTLEAHPDDPDTARVAVVWSGVQASRFGPYNDEGLRHHRLYACGLDRLHWVGEVLDSGWLAEVAAAVWKPAAHHYIVPTKEALVEVLADGLRFEREQG